MLRHALECPVIPYFEPPFFTLFDVRFDSWLVLVVLGIAAGTEYARARAIRTGLSVKVTVDCTLAMVGMGFIVAHLVHVLAYNPQLFAEDWKRILPWYGGYSSFGGFLGAAIAIPLFLRWKRAPTWAYTDNLAIGFVLGWAFGRTGCFSAHDHMGAQTSFFLAVEFPTSLGGPRHDLGLYEALLAWSMFAAFHVIDRRHPQLWHGFFSAWSVLLYAPVRFGLDFLRGTDLETVSRHSDVRWAGLTPAQYGAVVMFLFGLWILVRRRGAPQLDISQEAARDFDGPPPARSPEGGP
jgi:phosphatidylglycerol:prolipoprotein diacylglycerol transferase